MARFSLLACALVSCLVVMCTSMEARVHPEHQLGYELTHPEWQLVEHRYQPADVASVIRLYIALELRNSTLLESAFWGVSMPSSTSYGEHWTWAELSERVAPAADTVSRVMSWISRFPHTLVHEPSDMSTGDWVVLDVPVESASTMLRVPFAVYEHSKTGKLVVRAKGAYSVPRDLADCISFVGGVSHFPVVSCAMEKGTTPPQNQIVNPAVIRQQYNITVSSGTNETSSQAVHEFEAQYYSEKDLELFFLRNGLPLATVDRQVGFNNDSMAGGEAELDIQYLMGIGVNISTWFVSIPGLNEFGGDPYLEWIVLMLLLDDVPLTNSISYGDDEGSLSDTYLTRVASEMQKFGVTGHSLFFSSGDFGVGCNCSDPSVTSYVAHFPASSPYVTSVGATIGVPTVEGVEESVSFTGGGFSNFFPRPSFQDDAVNSYLNSATIPMGSFFNSSNRGYPDVAAFGVNFEIIEHGKLDYIGGTSASTPAVAGMFALINDARLNADLPPIGFASPMIYEIAGNADQYKLAFQDITKGNNGNPPCCAGFSCVDGWDPLSGFGSLNFGELLPLFLVQ